MFALAHYGRGDSVADPSPLFALLMSAVGIVSIALAIWLRFSTEILAGAVDRYTPYSILFSMGTFLIASRSLMMPVGAALRFSSLLVVVVIIGYLLADAWASWFRSYNPAVGFFQNRVEMAVYATDPGTEEGLGPSEPDEGRFYRSNLHSFLKSRGLSVFGSSGYQALGQHLPSRETSGELR